jgi:hypothetical protein
MTSLEIQNIVQSINNLAFNHEDLMSVVLDFADSYIKDHKKRILPYFNNPIFLQQSVLCVRESLVLSVNGLILSEDVPFNEILEGCINQEAQDYHLQQLNLNPFLKKEIILFWNSLRKEVFKTIYNNNKEVRQMTELPLSLLEERYNIFINKFNS